MSATPPCTPLFSRRLYSALVTSLPSGTSLCHCAGAVVLLLGALGHAHAGRPLGVDDAGVNDAGHGHLEMWWEGPRGERGTVLAAPAYAPIEGLELGALLARDLQGHATLQGVQAKWLWTAPAEQGCNAASSAGVQHTRQQSGNTVSVALLGTCTGDWGAVHANLGAQREPQPSGCPPGAWPTSAPTRTPRATSPPTLRPLAAAMARPPSRPGCAGLSAPTGNSTAPWGASKAPLCSAWASNAAFIDSNAPNQGNHALFRALTAPH